MSSPGRNLILTNRAPGTDASELCGICGEAGKTNVFWFSDVSRCAHSICYKQIESIEAPLTTHLASHYPDIGARNLAHAAAIRHIRTNLQGLSIKAFMDADKEGKIKAIFEEAVVRLNEEAVEQQGCALL